MGQAGIGRADGALVFFTAEHAGRPRELAENLRRETGTEKLVGCSAAGILTSAGEIEGAHGLAVLVIASDEIRIRPFLYSPLRDRDGEIGAAIGRDAALAADGTLLSLFPDTYNGRPQSLLEALERASKFIPVVGAGASESGALQATYQLCGDSVVSNAVAGFQICGAFQAHIEITQGCQPITAPMVITRAEKNLIFEIDNRPALEVFARVLKGPLAEDLRRALTVLFVGLPADRSENSVEAGKYVVRNIIGLDPRQGVVGVAEEVSEGETIIFAFRDGERARADLNQMLERQISKLEGKKPAFGIYFNCCARGSSLYGIPDIDSAYIRNALGDLPLIGMFGGYELAPLGRANRLFAYTGVLALITE